MVSEELEQYMEFQLQKARDNTGRTADDVIGNIYNLNIVVDGTENVGF